MGRYRGDGLQRWVFWAGGDEHKRGKRRRENIGVIRQFTLRACTYCGISPRSNTCRQEPMQVHLNILARKKDVKLDGTSSQLYYKMYSFCLQDSCRNLRSTDVCFRCTKLWILEAISFEIRGFVFLPPFSWVSTPPHFQWHGERNQLHPSFSLFYIKIYLFFVPLPVFTDVEIVEGKRGEGGGRRRPDSLISGRSRVRKAAQKIPLHLCTEHTHRNKSTTSDFPLIFQLDTLLHTKKKRTLFQKRGRYCKRFLVSSLLIALKTEFRGCHQNCSFCGGRRKKD